MKNNIFQIALISTCLFIFINSAHSELIKNRKIIRIEDGTYTYVDANLKDNAGSEIVPNETPKLKREKVFYYPDSTIRKDKPWSISCNKKKFDNTRICNMYAGNLWIFLIDGRYSVSVGSNHYPRSKGGLRIDNSFVTYGYEGELSKPLNIIEKLKKGKFAYTRYKEWPYTYDIDSEIDLTGFTGSFNDMLEKYKAL